MHAKHFRAVGLVIGLLALMAGVWLVEAQDAGDIPHITIEATAQGFTVPAEMPEGVVQITFENHSEATIEAVVARLNEGVTLEDFGAAEAEGGQAALAMVSVLGGSIVMPEMTADVIFDLAPGTYALVNVANQEQGFQSFTVADGEGEGAAPPEAEVEVVLLDFAFGMPIEIPAGPQLWHILNVGVQPHMMIVTPLDDTMTVGEFNQTLLRGVAFENVEGPQPAIVWFMSPGEQAWVTYDLEPGTYSVVCGLPDMTGSGHTHAESGMRQIIIVTG